MVIRGAFRKVKHEGEPGQTSKVKLFAKIGDGSKPLSVFAKKNPSQIFPWEGSECLSGHYTDNKNSNKTV